MMRSVGVVLVALVLLGASDAFACSCVGSYSTNLKNVRDAAQRATVVFTGFVESSSREPMDPDSGGHIETTVFRVTKVWKGKLAETVTFQIDIQCCVCGRSFDMGETYLVYGYRSDEDPYFTTDICSRTKKKASAAWELSLLSRLLRSGEI